MRYIDRTGKARSERGESKEISSLGALTKEACAKAKRNGLGVLKTSWGPYKVIRESGLGYEEKSFSSLEAVDTYIKTKIG